MSAAVTTYPPIVPFESAGMDNLERGTDGLLYVMAHGHAATVPTDVLMFAEKVGVISIARRKDEVPAVLADVNRALDIIAATLRARAKLDAEPILPGQTTDAPDVNGGQHARLVPPVPTRPPAGIAIPARIDDTAL